MGTLRSWEVEQLAKCTPGERDSRDSVARPASIQSAPDPHAEGIAASSAARPRLREASVLAARTAPGHRRSREAPDRDARRADDFSAGHGIRQWGGRLFRIRTPGLSDPRVGALDLWASPSPPRPRKFPQLLVMVFAASCLVLSTGFFFLLQR